MLTTIYNCAYIRTAKTPFPPSRVIRGFCVLTPWLRTHGDERQSGVKLFKEDILKTYFLNFRVSPLPENTAYGKVDKANTFYWVVDETPENALRRATDHLKCFHWNIENLEAPVAEVSAEQFRNQDISLKHLQEAQYNWVIGSLDGVEKRR